MGNIFIAFSGDDERFLTNLREQLRVKTSHKIWASKFDMEIGKEWRAQVEENFYNADYFVPLISNSFLSRPEPRRELIGALDLADQNKLKILPMIIEEVINIPYYIKSVQYLPYQDFGSMTNALISALSSNSSPLSNRETFEKHIDGMDFDPPKMVKLAEEVVTSHWEKKDDKSKAIKHVADKLKNHKHLREALHLYTIIISKLYDNDTLRVARAGLYSQLEEYQAADNDCAEVLSRDANNIWALHKRFWINNQWMLSTTHHVNAQQALSTICSTLEDLQKAPAVFLDKFLSASLLVLSAGAEKCKSQSIAEFVTTSISQNIRKIHALQKKEDRVSFLRALKYLSKFFREIGDEVSLKKATSQMQTFEDKWKIFNY